MRETLTVINIKLSQHVRWADKNVNLLLQVQVSADVHVVMKWTAEKDKSLSCTVYTTVPNSRTRFCSIAVTKMGRGEQAGVNAACRNDLTILSTVGANCKPIKPVLLWMNVLKMSSSLISNR